MGGCCCCCCCCCRSTTCAVMLWATHLIVFSPVPPHLPSADNKACRTCRYIMAQIRGHTVTHSYRRPV
eukprot:10279313-Alexandrium_andersonii.AAC.1